MSRLRLSTRLQPLIAALLLLPLGLGGVDLHTARGADHEVVARGDQFVGVDCDGGRERHVDSSRLERREPCGACARILLQHGTRDALTEALPALASRRATRPAEPAILGSLDFSPARGRAPPLS